jgi:hypothetical protein
MKKIAFFIIAAMIAISCNNDDDDNTPVDVSLLFNFSQNWEGTNVSAVDIGTTIFTNENSDQLTIARLRYLISNIQLTNMDGVTTNIEGYQLVDLSDSSTLSFVPNVTVLEGSYTMSFVYGFNEEDNVEGAYPDLNAASWNWPVELGGGYHFMQMDGQYDVNTTAPMPYNYHNGTAKVSDGDFEQNFVIITIPNLIEVREGGTIEIIMDISEWYKNPYTWDLSVYNTSLMANYDAQKKMNLNAGSVFSAISNNP